MSDYNNGERRFSQGLGPGNDPLQIAGYFEAEARKQKAIADHKDFKDRRAKEKLPVAIETTTSQNQTKSGNGGAFVFFGIVAAFGWMLSSDNNSKIDPEAVASPVTDSRRVAAPLSSGEFNCTARGKAISLTFSFHNNRLADGQLVEYQRVVHPTELSIINLESISNKSKSCDQAYSTLFKHYPKP